MQNFIFWHEQSDSDTGPVMIWGAFSPSICFTEFSCRENFLLPKGNQLISSWKTKSNVQ